MILIDFSQVAFSAILEYVSREKENVLDIDSTRHIILSRIVSLKKAVAKYDKGPVVLCLDGKNYWRRSSFKYYKFKRADAREKSSFDWESFFKHFDVIKDEFRANLPYKFIEVHTAEGDDIIAVLSRLMAPHEKTIVIVSADKDLLQLQALGSNIVQYSPLKKKLITQSSEGYSLIEHIIKGDSGDGVPNYLSPDNSLAENIRQKPITKKILDIAKSAGINNPEKFCTTSDDLERFKRNKMLVDLTEIPGDLAKNISDEFMNYDPPKMRLFTYLTKNKMMRLLENIADFT